MRWCSHVNYYSKIESLVTLFYLFMSIKDRPLLCMVVRSQTYYPKHILACGSGKTRYALVVDSDSFRTD